MKHGVTILLPLLVLKEYLNFLKWNRLLSFINEKIKQNLKIDYYLINLTFK